MIPCARLQMPTSGWGMRPYIHVLLLAAAACLGPALPASAQPAAADPESTLPAPVEVLDWTSNPGAFENSLLRRYENPLFPPSRRSVSEAELKSAIIRDADDAREVLADFVDLALEQRRMARLDDAADIEEALRQLDDAIARATAVGGEAFKLSRQLQKIRLELVSGWLADNPDDAAIQSALARFEEELAGRRALENNPFIAQLFRKDGPTSDEDLAAALLSEDVATIEQAMPLLEPARWMAVQRSSPAVVSYASFGKAEIPDLDAKLQALKTGDPRRRNP